MARIALPVALAMLVLATRAEAQTFQPGDVVEYRDGGNWERGTVVRELPGGSQFLIRRKPSQFFPEGAEAAYAPADLRPPQAGAAPPQSPSPPPGLPPTVGPAAIQPGGLLGKEELIAFAKQRMGDNPFGNPQREAVLNEIRDLVKARGVSFAADADFDNRMSAQGTASVHISYALQSSYGPTPKLDDYFGTWLLRAANRGSQSKTTSGSTVIVTTTDSQAESGRLTIDRDGTYEWETSRGDPPEKWLRGSWREVKPEEFNPWEGGPAVWLLKAKQDGDYMVRMGREPGWPGWIDVGAGKARTPIEYGRKP